jgi:2-oxoglutarate dehydrogenase E2 component (dihydrolipoamide succinyltransferase)
MRIADVRTSIKLEPEFWSYLKEVAQERSIRLSRLVNEVAMASPGRTNLASTLRTFSLVHAQLRWQGLEQELQKLTLAGNTQDLTRVRKATAKAMLNALQTSAQLTAAVEVDVTSIMNLRAAQKDAFRAREGVSLSPLPLISRAVCMVLPRHPALNSSIDTEAGTATFRNYINLGMAVDTEAGLLVPNVKDAQDLTVPGLARRIADLASRARSKKLTPDDISGATFTITNTGSRGTLFDTPIFTPPQVAILATCAIEKRPVVVSDAYGDSIAIRWMSYLCLSYDHRMVDGADAARFLQDLKYVLETHDFASELGA